jgi:nucleoside-diphosphate-sugar epimerase
MTRVLVTGASGFIGGRLCEYLHTVEGATVRVLLRRYGGAARIGRLPIEIAGFHRGEDLATAANGCDHIVHCAHDWSSPERNLALATGVVDAAARAGVRSVVYLSSLVVYYPAHEGPMYEDSEWASTDWNYALEKRRLTEAILEAGDDHGVSVIVLEPSCVYGPFSVPFAAMPVAELRRGRVVVPPDDEGVCNLIHVDDLVAGIMGAARSTAAAGERFIMTGPEAISWGAFYERLATSIGGGTILQMTAAEIAELGKRKPAQRARRLVLDPRWLLSAESLAPVRKVARRLIGDRLWQGSKEAMPRPLVMPSPDDIVFRWSLAQARSDKASRVFGFEPRMGFYDGMSRLSDFIAWARL